MSFNRAESLYKNFVKMRIKVIAIEGSHAKIVDSGHKEFLISELVSMAKDLETSNLDDVFRNGYRGYSTYTDLELISKYLTWCGGEGVPDSDFEGFGILKYLEETVNKKLVSLAVEKHILS